MIAAAIDVEPGTFLAVMAASAVGGTASALLTGRGLLVPTVVVELVLGVLIGPEVLGLEANEFISFFADLGLGMLFFRVALAFFVSTQLPLVVGQDRDERADRRRGERDPV